MKPLALLVLPALLRACGSPSPDGDDSADDSVAAAPAAAPSPAPTPEPPRRVAFTARDLAPFADGEAERVGADALRLALQQVAAKQLDEALRTLESDTPVPDLAAMLRGEILSGLRRDADAIAAFAAVPEGSRRYPEAAVRRAALLVESGAADDALALLGEKPEAPLDGPRADLVRGRAFAALGRPEDADAAWLRVFRDAPGSAADRDASALLAPRLGGPPAEHASIADRVARARALGKNSANDAVITLLSPIESQLDGAGDAVACEGLLELGRAFHKNRDYASSVPRLDAASATCPDGDLRARALYLLAQGKARGGSVDESIACFLRLPEEAARHSLADDGLFQAAQLQIGERRFAEAAALCERLAAEFPDGDMRAAALWNLALTRLRAGDAGAEEPLGKLAALDPLGPERDDALRGRYFLARAQAARDPHGAVDAFETLARTEPTHWFGALALWQIAASDPPRAAGIASHVRARASTLRATPPEPGQYDVDPALAALPGLRAAVALLRSGIPEEAAAELEVALGPKPWERWDGESLVFASHLYELAGDPARSHHLLRRAFAARMEEAPASAPALFHAYPLAYWDAVRGATDSFGWDPLAFQALVREESGFSPAIVSWAGAIGLSQLMWPTAKDTAKRMGLRIDRASLNDPATNARIGATYLNGLLTRYRGHLPLAIAAYNAGPGAVSKWVGERPGDPLDLWVESIPYDQTRDYVKRVVGSFHTYRFLRGDSVPVAPLRVGPVQAAIDAADPTWPG